MLGPVILAKAEIGEEPVQMPSRTILQNIDTACSDYVGECVRGIVRKAQAS